MPNSRTVWQRTAKPSGLEETTGFRKLDSQVSADVAIVGGGITGMTTALMLQEAGKHVVVVEARQVGSGVSGANNGHLTGVLLDAGYSTLIRHFNVEETRLVLESQMDAIETIARLIRTHRIDCDFRRLDGYLYATDDNQSRALKKEADAFMKLDLPFEEVPPAGVPLPFHVERAVRLTGQACMDPLKYVQALARIVEQRGGEIYEDSPVLEITHKYPCLVTTQDGSVLADDLVMATHTPIGFHPLIQSKIEPYRSYVIGFRTRDPAGEGLQDALYWEMSRPFRSIGLCRDDEGPLILLGGEDHRTGELRETGECLARLEEYACSRFNVQSVDYRWSSQLYHPADGLPYIGSAVEEPHLYVATGFSKSGLTHGTLAAMLITDEILGLAGPLDRLFDPNRVKPLAAASGLASENLGALSHFFGDRLKRSKIRSLNDVPPGEGRIVDSENGKMAVFRDEFGDFRCFSPICSHAGCLVQWNAFEKSWDCPCHGGRYDNRGNVLNGPPVKGLDPLTVHLPHRY